ncbi:MAG TPA: hypothetical protein VE152_12990, partial [Acidimicrobiales bacterium]|nr:hypothetical protein [Acidimicrobiales bacterium]
DPAAHQVRYLAVLTAEDNGVYGPLTHRKVRYFAARARKVFSFSEPDYKQVIVYQKLPGARW